MSNEGKRFAGLPLTEILVPGCIAASLLVMFFNVPGPLIDWLLSFNITLAVIILLTTFFVRKPLEFSVFPTLLLATTLFRLVLNVATTRLILTEAGTLGDSAAGEVVRAFSRFIGHGNLIVGIVIFAIFVVIQFVVITKGATRISEVAARFTLDGLPGRQMAIDADLAAGAIDERQARERRAELTESADFFGAMDGAGKFVRGDAVAGLLIIFVNMIGGVLIGTFQDGRPITETLAIYTTLTIGDGLVSQVPALLISLATGILVTRSSRSSNLSVQLIGQLFARPTIFALGGIFLGVLIFTGLPALPLSVTAAGCFALALILAKRQEKIRREKAENERNAEQLKRREEERSAAERIENYLAVDPLELQIGVGLVRLLSGEGSEAMKRRLRLLREEIAAETGIIVPKIRVRDILTLDEYRYRIRLGDETAAEGAVRPEMLLAIDAERSGTRLEGIRTVEPATGVAAFWIDGTRRDKAEIFGFRVEKPIDALLGHLKEVIRSQAAELLTRDATAHLLDELRKTSPAVVDELIPNPLKLGQVQLILKRLLRERVPIRRLGEILEALGDAALRTVQPIAMTEQVRIRLARTISNRYRDETGRLHAVLLDPSLEDLILRNADLSGDETVLTLPPDDADDLVGRIENCFARFAGVPHLPVLLVSETVRPAIRELIADRLPRLAVLSFREITRETEVVSEGLVARQQRAA